MKKRMMALAFALMLLLMAAGCGSKDISESPEVWARFSEALKQTEQLAFYEITENYMVDGKTMSTHIVLTNDDMGRMVAYKSTDAGELWWFQGLTYDSTGAAQVKYAQGIDAFLGISDNRQVWEYSSVNDVKMNKGIITFSVEMEEYESCNVAVKVGEKFINQITVEFVRQGEQTSEIIEYVYKDPGQKPDVVLPENLSDYHY